MGLSITVHHYHSLLLFFISTMAPTFIVVSSLGINYGRIANNLPSPENAVPLLKSIGATRVKLYDADPRVLKAFANTNIEITIGLGNEYLSEMQDPDNALAWVKTNIQCHYPATKITSLSVGNEVLTSNDTSLSALLLPAMQNIHTALSILHLDQQVDVTSAYSLAILQTSYPPSAAMFRPDLLVYMTSILDFHIKTASPLLINAYPFLAYKANPKHVSLDFVLFQANNNSTGNAIIVDPATKLRYDNMLFAQTDAVHSALEKVGYEKVCVQISETGWPSKGDEDEPGATAENANKYNANLIKLMQQKRGTPMRPNANLNIHVFALFNENQKPGPTSERNFGLFKPDMTPAYPLGLGGTAPVTSANTTSSGDSPAVLLPQPPGSSNGYFAVTSDTGRLDHMHRTLVVLLMFWLVVGGGSISMALHQQR